MYNWLNMLKKLIENDRLLLTLIQNSSITITQLDTLVSYVAVQRMNGKLQQMLVARDNSKITKGSFIRTLKQAKGNLKESIYSLLVLSYLGIVDNNFMIRFVKIIELFEGLKDTKANSDVNQIIVLIDLMCDKLTSL